MAVSRQRRRLRRALSAATIAAAVLSPAAPAWAAPGYPALAPCGPGAATAADDAIATQLKPLMNGRRLGSAVTGVRIACARVIVATVQSRGLGQRAAVIAVTTAIAESTLNNHAVAYDHDSLGLFQQRPSQGWGKPAQVVDPIYATNAFLNAMLRKHPGGSWMTGDIGAICQRVQGSALPLAYAPEAHDAQLIVARLWTEPGPAATPQPTAPSGPYQKALAAAGTQLGALAGRHELALADWNGDNRPDLFVVEGTETASGKTEIRIMDGAANFAALLLTRATTLDATDNRQAYAIADVNGDKRPDLVVVQRFFTSSGNTEVTVLDGASAFRQQLLHSGTPLPATDERYRFAVTDWNGDAHPDLVVTQTSGTAGNRMEVEVLDGAANFQRHLAPKIVTPEPANPDHRVAVTDFNNDRRPDLVIIETSGKADGKTRLRVLDGAAGLQRTLVKADTAPGITHHLELLITEWNGDHRPDLMLVQENGTASGRTEMVVLGG
ncbi:FG-GAP repeat domain-containing protein [Actinoplanes flavus]|uniref:VCBS repeat-containing protein n=1 Tax=Actinoplanes flavus TaxID=2820290 RepID=A0ABS3UTJ6_9ACTN|nr:VCBS repeat-containing protein [Actinoplanes flavus]MBO3741916.1 VCBS repeat-containing protein [Actinoplanes flavus]